MTVEEALDDLILCQAWIDLRPPRPSCRPVCFLCHETARQNDAASIAYDLAVSQQHPFVREPKWALMKQCSRCREAKADDQFPRVRGKAAAACKACARQYASEYRRSHPEVAQAWRDANPDRRRESLSAWRSANKERDQSNTKAWRAANPDRVKDMRSRWVDAHRERIRISGRARDAVARAIERGDLVRPGTCEECGVTVKRIEAAHDDYTKPLQVRWLCKPCHARWDHDDPKTKGVSVPLNRAVGARIATTKLTESAVRAIRERYADGRANGVELAQEFGVSTTAIYRILRGRTWAYVS